MKDITANHDASYDFSQDKKTVEGVNANYFCFSKEAVAQIAAKEPTQVSGLEWDTLAQCLFPSYEIASGLFDGFLIFRIAFVKKYGCDRRIDPPEAYWFGVTSYRDNAGPESGHQLVAEIKSLFEANGAACSEGWERLFEGTVGKEPHEIESFLAKLKAEKGDKR